ncbi:MAG TPA: hypothetical protein VHI71_10670 [Actinomycetota bacterium]|nr:hypothetical protein [Actinomycetota bacterium]
MAQKMLTSRDALKTYRYLRLGMVGAVVLLATSILIEHGDVVSGCWQTSISAYYYTPVRAVFVGAMITVGFALIVIKGRSPVEDAFLNAAGMFAPVVGIAPTTDVGRCWSLAPNPLPVEPDGSLARWVVANIDNNFPALLVVAAVGILASGIIAVLDNQGVRGTSEPLDRGKILTLVAATLTLLVGWWLFENWGDFYTKMHGYSAILMFVFLIGAVGSRVYAHRANRGAYFWVYLAVGLVMVVGGAFVWLSRIFEEHTVFALEALEIAAFAVFWLVQTWEHWDEGELSDTPLTT